MSPTEKHAALALYAAYRAGPLLPREEEEFVSELGVSSAQLVDAAIRDVAQETGRVTLAGIVQRHARLREAALQALLHQRDAAKPRPEATTNLGYPTKPGEATMAYLVGIAFAGMDGRANAKRTADRYVRGGFVLREHADEIVNAVPPPGTVDGRTMARILGRAVKAIEARIGGDIATRRAEEWVSASYPREPGEDEPPRFVLEMLGLKREGT